jgi:uncharacterized protein YecT (DUF1311 family)
MRAILPTSRTSFWLAALLLAIATGCRPTATDSTQTPSSPIAASPSSTAAVPPTAPLTASPEDTAPSPPPATASSEAIDCSNPEGSAAVNQCDQRSYETADQQLNAAYQQLKATLSREEQAQLTEAETAWIKFRDSNCEFESSHLAGQPLQPSARYSCLRETTKARTAELQAQMNPL